MTECSGPGCRKDSVGFGSHTNQALVSGQRETIKARRKEGRVPKPPGEICLDHLLVWFPGRDREWMLAWVDRQNKRSGEIEAADEAAAIYRLKHGVDKKFKLTTGAFTR